MTMHEGEHSYLPQNTGEALAIALAFAAIVIPNPSQTRPMRIVRLLESPIFVAVGLASYSLFLWHYPIISWLRDNGFTLGGGWADLAVNLVIVACVAGALSALTYRYVEVPALRHKRSTRVQVPADENPPAVELGTAQPLVPSGDSAVQLSQSA
jgi:peptidoglycan/LPS O-acetylase OafA/YrhL